ncbi:tubby-like F-box protein 7-like protein [Corchorus olitorius]|uniref:Tubby-like F-box protein 7-like protein n=1 Tax=Corchorus olitorius TaxID=93759 RepID=A0A1R3J4M5_9ROSI|nr:tubby-like F-box protein 7-like protein [Corchorus olitorius]
MHETPVPCTCAGIPVQAYESSPGAYAWDFGLWLYAYDSSPGAYAGLQSKCVQRLQSRRITPVQTYNWPYNFSLQAYGTPVLRRLHCVMHLSLQKVECASSQCSARILFSEVECASSL